MNSIGKRLEKLLHEQRLHQKDLAKKLLITKSSVNDWILGRAQPKLNTVVQIAEILGVTTDFLLGREFSHIEESADILQEPITQYQSLTAQELETKHLKEKIELLMKQTQNQDCIIKLLKGEIPLPKNPPKKVIEALKRLS